MVKRVVKPLVNVINLILIRVYISGFLVGSKVLTVTHVRLFDRAENPQIFGVYCGVPPIYMGLGRYYGLFNCVLTIFLSGQMLLRLAPRAYSREAV